MKLTQAQLKGRLKSLAQKNITQTPGFSFVFI